VSLVELVDVVKCLIKPCLAANIGRPKVNWQVMASWFWLRHCLRTAKLYICIAQCN
jgi:hypothetical protein